MTSFSRRKNVSRLYSDKEPAAPSEITSEWVSEQIKAFLAKGGKIEQVPEGASLLKPEDRDE
jgi:hypothetical protein